MCVAPRNRAFPIKDWQHSLSTGNYLDFIRGKVIGLASMRYAIAYDNLVRTSSIIIYTGIEWIVDHIIQVTQRGVLPEELEISHHGFIDRNFNGP
jgi:hypothetical protein